MAQDSPESPADASLGRLAARPGAAPADRLPPGPHRLGLGNRRDGLLVLPQNHDGSAALPLAVMLHGAVGFADGAARLVQEAADRHGVALLAPDSRDPRSWDLIRARYGPDVAFLDEALAQTFARLPVRPDRIAIAGFSDGGSYALSLGLANGDLFSAILAFSPGFAAPATTVGAPWIFISHGRDDAVLPVATCGRRIAAHLAQAGYSTAYHEFAGGHAVPPDLADAAFASFVAGRAGGG
ncbi:alpha/beta hydrolase [Methylobacterium nodulans]|uniref:Phospholipase/Carboxylesterase n=1 Tax=Methylobacterium nodulans (strain LMG 21967 / CNCM I-2342 / ORS 2060) TaxID=460265 RepID=B8IR61_METNO|nr:alpha/beta hydrolase-fold protein [Methylobacterium nodulans]ACL56763.1 phospholipase/Carboxylesterase [Methylobacterium nodulans ORS 2060]